MGKKTCVNPGTFVCHVCRRRLAKGSKYNHMQTHTEAPAVNFVCAHKNCCKTLSTKSGLHCHEKSCWRNCSVHAEREANTSSVIAEEPTSYCRACKRTFSSRKLLLKHRRRSHCAPGETRRCPTLKPARKFMPNVMAALHESNQKEKEWLRVKVTGSKGRGVFAKKPFLPKQIICEYVGDLISASDLNSRKNDSTYDTSYLFEFRHNSGRPIAIDALRENGTIGRLINHTRIGNPNCRPIKVIDNSRKPHIAFEAKCVIHIGDELLYDYEDRECYVDWMWNS